MTPREFYREMAAASLRQSDELRRDVTQAWFAASFFSHAMVGKLPDLQIVLAKVTQTPRVIQGRTESYRESRLKLEWLSGHIKRPLQVYEVKVG